jgi:hypothetical protein
MNKIVVTSLALVVLFFSAAAHAVQFDYLAPGFSQEIYTGPLASGPGMAWSGAGNLLTRNGSDILEYSLTQVPLAHQGTNLHPQTVTHTIPGLSTSGFGLAKGLDGYIYTPTAGGLERFSTNLTGAAQSLTGTVGGQGYGATTLPDGRIVYVAGSSTNEVYVYTPNANPSLGTNTLIYTAPSLIDDIEASPTGAIALALQQASAITVIDNAGNVLNSNITGLSHHPDGLAFGDGVTANWLYSNNNDGSITQYQLGPNYSGVPTIVDIATQSPPPYGKAYGDLAAVGPDCAFYVTQFDNFGLNNSTSGVGTHWDNGVTNNEASIVRIAAVDPRTGVEYCGFGSATENVPEPGIWLLMLSGIGMVSLRAGRRRAVRS